MYKFLIDPKVKIFPRSLLQNMLSNPVLMVREAYQRWNLEATQALNYCYYLGYGMSIIS